MSIDAVLFTLIIKPASSSTHLNLGGECRAGIRTLNPRIESSEDLVKKKAKYRLSLPGSMQKRSRRAAGRLWKVGYSFKRS